MNGYSSDEVSHLSFICLSSLHLSMNTSSHLLLRSTLSPIICISPLQDNQAFASPVLRIAYNNLDAIALNIYFYHFFTNNNHNDKLTQNPAFHNPPLPNLKNSQPTNSTLHHHTFHFLPLNPATNLNLNHNLHLQNPAPIHQHARQSPRRRSSNNLRHCNHTSPSTHKQSQAGVLDVGGSEQRVECEIPQACG